MKISYLANAGCKVANVKNPVCPGWVGGADEVKTFIVSLGCFKSVVKSWSLLSSPSFDVARDF